MSEHTISASDVKKLRDVTGAGMMDCKKALSESNGDFDGAYRYLRKKVRKYLLKELTEKLKKVLYLLSFPMIAKKGVIVKLSGKLTLLQKMKILSH
ncbi:MAG: hypothetical protein R2771_13515 [Saprospiraceae bacterium]